MMSGYIDKRTKITDDNAAECAMALRSMEKDRDSLVEKLRHYPIEMCFGGLRYVFSQANELDSLISRLDVLLTAYCAKKSKSRG
jgi:hypothetical protein